MDEFAIERFVRDLDFPIHLDLVALVAPILDLGLALYCPINLHW